MDWRKPVDDFFRVTRIFGGSAVVTAVVAGSFWWWWARFWLFPPPVRGLFGLAAAVLVLLAWLVGLKLWRYYSGPTRYRPTTTTGPLDIHHARWMPVRNANVTVRLRDAIRNGRLDLAVNRDVLGDPFYGQLKELVVTYSTGDGLIQTLVVTEDQILRIP